MKNLKIPAHIRKLHPLLDDVGILRVGGRLENALIKNEAKHPIILPYRHHVTDLIISQHHQKTGHLGQEFVLSSLRQLYWIIKGRLAVRRVIGSCFPCKKLGAVRGEQLMADLPKERLMSGDPPFSHIGVDYFGPLYVRQGRSNVKRYGCLFTCLVIRAVHIEVVHSLVLIADENVPRGKWPLGRVIHVFHGNDGYVRSARVQTSSTILTRPVTKLCFLEGEKAH